MANSVTVQLLAADVLARRVRMVLRLVAFGNWKPAVALREALDAYTAVRASSELKAELDDPQKMNVQNWPEPPPPTLRSEMQISRS